ncbi:MAG: peptide deformylase [Balneolaceae bacterium]
MAIREILLLGNPKLVEQSVPVSKSELNDLKPVVGDLHDTMMDFRRCYNAGRAIAAPQIGVMKRLVYMHIDQPVVFINPVLEFLNNEKLELWDDCMSFPELLVRVKRYAECRITYRDMKWRKHEEVLTGDLSELLQHECDHLDGILATDRAAGSKAFTLRSQRHFIQNVSSR